MCFFILSDSPAFTAFVATGHTSAFISHIFVEIDAVTSPYFLQCSGLVTLVYGSTTKKRRVDSPKAKDTAAAEAFEIADDLVSL